MPWIKFNLKVIIFITFVINSVYSQNSGYNNLTFERLSIEHGLSQITVHSILQDSKGFLWFGTEDGLNRFDGYDFTVYQYDSQDSASISDNFIWSLFEDSDNNIWIGTNSGGLNKYNYTTNTFQQYLDTFSKQGFSEVNNIRVIFEDTKKNIWIGSENRGLYRIVKDIKKIDQINLLQNETVSVRTICQDDEGIIWIGTNNNGLFEITMDGDVKSHYLKSNYGLSSNSVWALNSSEKTIWIGTYSGGLNKFNKVTKKFTNYLSENSNNSLIHNNITSLYLDQSEHLWIGTEGGLSILDIENEIFLNHRHNLSDLRSLSNNFIRCINGDKSNLIWIGTVGGGVSKLNLHKKFNQFNHNPTDENSLSHNMIRAISEDAKGNVWIGTLGSGLNRFDKTNNIFQRFNVKNSNLSSDIITSVYEDKFGTLWVGSWGGGLIRLILDGEIDKYKIKKVSVYKHNGNDITTITSNIIQDVYEDSKGNLWIGTEDGLDKFNRSKNIFIHNRNNSDILNSLSDNRIQSKCILEDRFGYLWVGTWNGLNRIKLNKSKSKNNEAVYKHFFKSDGLSDNRVISIYEDTENDNANKLIFWVGTIGGGLNKIVMNVNSGGEIGDFSIQVFTQKDGLPSNVIYGILGDNNYNLWLSTNNGLSKFIKTDNQFKNYDVNDGLQSNQFFWGAFHKCGDGEMFFGGINGLNSFDPDKLKENNRIPPIYITKILMSDADGSNQFISENLEKLNSGQIIKMPYSNYSIKIFYTALDLTTPNKNKYKCMLENFDDNWIDKENVNFASYSNISDGEFSFRVKGSNNDGLWNEKGASFSFIIATPFWKTWWFIVTVVLLFTSLVIYLITAQIKNILAVERLRTKLAADLHDNIGSSLTEISILSEVINTRLKTEDKETIKYLNKISDKSRSLIDKMSDIVWLVNPQRDSLYDLILRLQDTYSDLLSDTNISFRCENLKSLEKISLSMEHRQNLFLIFKEAINNSITHSKCTDLYLKTNVDGRKITILLEDNGVGFDLEVKKRGNGLNNMRERAKKIGGKLIIQTEPMKGTVLQYFGYIN